MLPDIPFLHYTKIPLTPSVSEHVERLRSFFSVRKFSPKGELKSFLWSGQRKDPSFIKFEEVSLFVRVGVLFTIQNHKTGNKEGRTISLHGFLEGDVSTILYTLQDSGEELTLVCPNWSRPYLSEPTKEGIQKGWDRGALFQGVKKDLEDVLF